MQLIFFIGSGQVVKLGHLTLQSFMLLIFRFSPNPWCSGLWRISAAWSAKDSSRSSSKSATCGYKKRTFFISCQSRLLRSETVVSCVWNQVFIDETLMKAQLAEARLTMLGKILSFCCCLRTFLIEVTQGKCFEMALLHWHRPSAISNRLHWNQKLNYIFKWYEEGTPFGRDPSVWGSKFKS